MDCSKIKIKVYDKSRAFQKTRHQKIKTKQIKHINLIHESNENKYLE